VSAGEMLVLQWRNPGGGEMLASVRSSREPPKSGRRIGPTHPRSANTLRHHLEGYGDGRSIDLSKFRDRKRV
jgi:hypothetical protein